VAGERAARCKESAEGGRGAIPEAHGVDEGLSGRGGQQDSAANAGQ